MKHNAIVWNEQKGMFEINNGYSILAQHLKEKKAFGDKIIPSHQRNLIPESLGVNPEGCKCQTHWLFIIENGEVVEVEQLSDDPTHLRERKDFSERDRLKKENGEYFVEVPREDYGFIHNRVQIAENGILQIKVNHYEAKGKEYFEEPCPSVCEVLDLYHECEDVAKTLPDGNYEVLAEAGCWASYAWDYGCYEGDGEVAIRILPSIHIQNK